MTSNTTALSHLGLLAISGADAAKFLQGQVTCDVREVSETQSRLGAICNPKGRVLATFRLFQYQTIYYLQMPRELIAQTLQTLQKYAVFFKTQLEDVSAQWQQFGLSSETIDVPLKNVDEVIPQDDSVIVHIPGLPPRYLLLTLESNPLSPALQDLISKHHTSSEAWQLLDITAGIPSIYLATSGEYTPQQINYPLINGVSFTKGCYTGQEIVARMHYLGKAKQQMYRVQFTNKSMPNLNTKLFAVDSNHTQEVGHLLAIAADPAGGFQALAVLQNSALDQTITVENTDGAILKVLDLPYT